MLHNFAMKPYALAVALLATACSNSVSQDQLYPEIYKAYCSQYARCGLAHSESACKAIYDGYLKYMSVPNQYESSIAAGKIRYNGDRARRCIDAMAATPCSDSVLALSSNEDCRLIFEGLVPVGGACGTSECVPSAYCTVDAGGTECPGTCVERVAEGGAAKYAAMCTFPLVLVDGKCTKRRKTGEACHESSECESYSCSEGLCRTPGASGDACSKTASCATFLNCVEGTCRLPADLGETCNATSITQCKVDLYCNKADSADGVCRERGTEGQACTAASLCMTPLACSGGKCTKPVGAGQSCTELICEPAYYCESKTKVCKDRLAEGQACTGIGSECQLDMSCRGGKCTKTAASGCH